MPTDQDFIQPFVDSASNVFTTMLGLSAVLGRVYVKNDNTAYAEVSAIMGTSEGGAEGLLVVSMSESVAKKVAGGFMGAEPDGMGEEVKECIGELLNMIAGGAKAKLEGTPYFFKLSIPTVVIGKHMEIHHKPAHVCTVAEIKLNDEAFVIEVSMRR